MNVLKKFIGTWELVDFYIQTDTGMKFYPFGKGAEGLIIYTKKHMSVIIKKEEQYTQKFPLEFVQKLSKIEKSFIDTNHIAYCGTFKLHITEKLIVHNVKVITLDGLKNIQFPRYYNFNKNKLTLTTFPLKMDNTPQINTPVLVWKKIS